MVVSQVKLLGSLAMTSFLLYFTIPPGPSSSSSHSPSPSASSSPSPSPFLSPWSGKFADVNLRNISPAVTRNLSELVLPEVRTVLVEPWPRPCQLEGRNKLNIFIAVFSAPANFLTRVTVRSTWAQTIREYEGVELIFFLGRDQDESVHNSVMLEAEKYNDLVVEDFQESYLNLTVKTTFLLKWISSSACSGAQFLFKVDDDVYVNPEKLWRTVMSARLFSAKLNPTERNIKYALIGHAWYKARANRNPDNRYYLSPDLYPQPKLPSFLSGTAYVFTGSLLPSLYSCALRTPLINLEDVFLTGLCATRQLGLKLSNNKHFIPRGPTTVNKRNICIFKNSVVVHNKYNPKLLQKLWNVTNQGQQSCQR